MESLVVHDDIVEQILIELDVKDLLRYKSVCKSWRSLITSSRFINHHLNRSHEKDCCNDELGHRRFYLTDEFLYSYNNNILLGSSNGLVCIFNYITHKLLVGNPLTREVRYVELPPRIHIPFCWGFGYDSSRDDYKVITISTKLENETYVVQVLSLKSNEWSFVGGLKYIFDNDIGVICNVGLHWNGVLCNGALHWIARDENMKELIICYDLSKNEFKEIPPPDDARFEWTVTSYLGIVKECICILSQWTYSSAWLMKTYNVKESWKLMRLDREMKYDILHHLRSPNEEGFIHLNKSWNYIVHHLTSLKEVRYPPRAPIFVQSLVSPHVNVNERSSDNKLEEGQVNREKTTICPS